MFLLATAATTCEIVAPPPQVPPQIRALMADPTFTQAHLPDLRVVASVGAPFPLDDKQRLLQVFVAWA